LKQFYNITLVLFSIFWVFIIFCDYWQKHPLYYHAIDKFKYLYLLIFYLFFTIGLAFFVNSKSKIALKLKRYVNWVSILSTIIILMLVSLFAYIQQINKLNLEINKISLINNIGVENIFYFIKGFFTVLFATFFVCFTARLLGHFFNQLLDISVEKPAEGIIDLSVGIMLLTTMIFYLGFLSLLKAYVLVPLFIIIILLNWKKALELLKALIKPIPIPDNLNWMAGISIALMLIITAVNFNQILRPIPTGFDALTTYVNLPRLISDYGSLVSGYQPHNWSLFMSMGFIIFDMTEVTLALSLIGGLFTIATLYYLGAHWLKIDKNYVWLILAAFYLTPTIVHQSSKELKVDLGLLFIQLSIITFFIIWYKKSKIGNNDIESLDVKEDTVKKAKQYSYSFGFLNRLHQLKPLVKLRKTNDKYMVVMGLLTGFALGVKLTSVFLMMAILSCIWILKQRTTGYFAIFFLAIFALLLAKVDNMGGLRTYNLSASIVQWIAFTIGIALLVYEFIINRELFIKKFSNSLIYALIVVFSFAPWVAKNYIDTRSTNIDILLNGKHIGPPISIEILDRNWKKANKKSK